MEFQYLTMSNREFSGFLVPRDFKGRFVLSRCFSVADPVAPDIAITPYFARGQEKLAEPEDPAARKINEEIFRQSQAIAGRSERLIASLAEIPPKEHSAEVAWRQPREPVCRARSSPCPRG